MFLFILVIILIKSIKLLILIRKINEKNYNINFNNIDKYIII